MASLAPTAPGIYCIQSKDGRRYVGSAVSIKKRWKEHRRQLESGNHHSRFMQRAWMKHGEHYFEFKVLVLCDRGNLLFFEQRFLDAWSPEYNTAPVAGSQLGYRHSDESRKRMSAARRKNFSPMKGRKHTPEALAKISANRKGKGGGERPPEWRAAIGRAHKGRVISQGQRAKISETLKGHKQSPEQIAKRAAKLRGRKMPAGFAESASLRMRGVKLTPAHCESIGKSKAKLTDEQVRNIRALRSEGVARKDLAIQFEIDAASITHIVNLRSYKWVI